MTRRFRLCFASAAAALTMQATLSAAQEFPAFQFSGYGTLGVVHAGTDRGDYIVDLFRPDGPGFSHDWSAKVDSRLGLQAEARFSPTLSAVVQVLSHQRYDDRFTPVVEWANVRYQPTPELSLRAGRIVLPLFNLTDTRHVGYANPWVRPPVEVYGMVPVSNSDGFDASYRMSLGTASNTVQLSVGRTNPHLPGADMGKAEADKLMVLVDTFESGFASARAMYGRAELTVDAIDRQFDLFRAFGPSGEAVAARNTLRDTEVWFTGLAASYDPGPWFVTGEWMRYDTKSVLGAGRSWYVSGGVRLGKFTPYATYATRDDSHRRSDPGIDLGTLPPALRPTAAALNAQLNQALAGGSGQSTVSLGVRWDFWRSAALKLQYDQVNLDAGSSGSFAPKAPGFPFGGRIGVYSVAVDFVF